MQIVTGKLLVDKHHKMPFEIEIEQLIIICDSEIKKEDLPKYPSFQRRFTIVEFPTVSPKQANGQPLNDKRNGRATLNKWEKQNESLRSLQESIEKTKQAIEIEEGKRKHPTHFFVPGVEKARIWWDESRKAVAHKYAHLITDKDQRIKFVRLYNGLNTVLNK